VDEADGMTRVFRALADPTRQRLLDRLRARNGQPLGALCRDLDLTRQGVTQHLAVLEAAGLIATVRRGREKLHYLNPVPLHEIAERWIARFERPGLAALSGLKHHLEQETDPMDVATTPRLVYVTYIATWAAPADADNPARHSRVTFEIEPTGETVRLTLVHEDLPADEADGARKGWALVLSGLKTYLETGRKLPFPPR
jgi:DNA-binding transcriptional ArsR family regulator